ncbi:hypothetical protein GYB22_02330 [bacterium]|nr:hypothetical protein [bacterium]
MDTEEIIENLDLTGGPDSWFDMWHTHVDWHGDGNKDWQTRKKYLDGLVDLFKELKIRLTNYPKPFQLWIWILESDSSQDAVYVHSPNPNAHNFPITMDPVNRPEPKYKQLKDYIDGLGLEIIIDNFENELQFYLFDKQTGVPLTKN